MYVAVEACDMRKGFNGLHALVTERLGEDLRQGALFVFSNRRHTRIKILSWDGTGIWVLTNKRLEQGTFAWPKKLDMEVNGVASFQTPLPPSRFGLILAHATGKADPEIPGSLAGSAAHRARIRAPRN